MNETDTDRDRFSNKNLARAALRAESQDIELLGEFANRHIACKEQFLDTIDPQDASDEAFNHAVLNVKIALEDYLDGRSSQTKDAMIRIPAFPIQESGDAVMRVLHLVMLRLESSAPISPDRGKGMFVLDTTITDLDVFPDPKWGGLILSRLISHPDDCPAAMRFMLCLYDLMERYGNRDGGGISAATYSFPVKGRRVCDCLPHIVSMGSIIASQGDLASVRETELGMSRGTKEYSVTPEGLESLINMVGGGGMIAKSIHLCPNGGNAKARFVSIVVPKDGQVADIRRMRNIGSNEGE